MYTTFNKALVAAIVGVGTLLALFVPSIATYINPTTLAGIAAVVTPILVYIFPNLPKDTA